MKPVLRCAIYTRKSTEEGLEQAFNSLDAQREACEAYIVSQKHEGWKALPDKYDDGGFSGGNMERPALVRLLADIKSGKVNVVVVYKVDRLTRALSDFAKIVEQFDAQGVSFVSVTQQFSTTSSMGRLTLNVLLSFAQFEREVAGERIRDKIAASKKKGMWMGGTIPLGYKPKDKVLQIVPGEAKIVRHIYDRYLQLDSVRDLEADLMAGKMRSREGFHFTRGALYQMLGNPVYIGKVRHKDQVYTGKHEPIISNELWQKAQSKLKKHGVENYKRKDSQPFLLTGLLFDNKGNRLTPTHTNKKGRRYRYYIDAEAARSPKRPRFVLRIPAGEIENLVLKQTAAHLEDNNDDGRHDVVTLLRSGNFKEQRQGVATLIEKVAIRSKTVVVQFKMELIELLAPLIIPYQFLTIGNYSGVIATDNRVVSEVIAQRQTLLKALIRGFVWRKMLLEMPEMTVALLAEKEGVNGTYLINIINLTFLAPDLIEAILDDDQSRSLPLQRLIFGFSLNWKKQRVESSGFQPTKGRKAQR